MLCDDVLFSDEIIWYIYVSPFSFYSIFPSIFIDIIPGNFKICLSFSMKIKFKNFLQYYIICGSFASQFYKFHGDSAWEDSTSMVCSFWGAPWSFSLPEMEQSFWFHSISLTRMLSYFCTLSFYYLFECMGRVAYFLLYIVRKKNCYLKLKSTIHKNKVN